MEELYLMHEFLHFFESLLSVRDRLEVEFYHIDRRKLKLNQLQILRRRIKGVRVNDLRFLQHLQVLRVFLLGLLFLAQEQFCLIYLLELAAEQDAQVSPRALEREVVVVCSTCAS